MSYVTCHVSLVTFHLKKKNRRKRNEKKTDKVVELVGGGSVINGATPSSLTRNMTEGGRNKCLP